MSKRLGGGKPAIDSAEHHVQKFVPGLGDAHLAAQQTGDVHVHVLAHGADGARIGTQLEIGNDGIADDVALTGAGAV